MLTPPATTRPRRNRVAARMSHRILAFERVSTVCVIGGIVDRVYGAMLRETTETRLCTMFVITGFLDFSTSAEYHDSISDMGCNQLFREGCLKAISGGSGQLVRYSPPRLVHDSYQRRTP